ncbi:MAG: hypothetical protein HKN67_07535 [Saprospiraceae bacterium]|nr:hypothetical protein [Saprospiraceae bacterium]
MSRIKIIIALLVATWLLNACNSSDSLETDPELEPYFQMFADEGLLRGIIVDYEAARIEGLLQDIPDSNVQGQCFRNEERPRKVIVDVAYWDNASEAEKEFIIFHELGHCFLDRGHLDTSNPDGTCVSIMHSNPNVCDFNLTDKNRKEYLNELFFN